MNQAFFIVSSLALGALPALAVLGGSAESVAVDQTRLAASKHAVVEMQAYTVHELSRDDGTMVREYVTPAGKVFGVSWTGPTIPDLSQVLGSYNAEYQSTVHSKAGRRRVAVVHNPDLVVESSGHGRTFYGRAYLNSMLPGGVPQETVK